MPRGAFALKIQIEICHPQCARRVSGLSRNGPQGVFPQVPWERGWHQTINYPTIREDNCVTFLLFLVFSLILATSGLSRSHG